jgi:excinuclease ABC subunit C
VFLPIEDAIEHFQGFGPSRLAANRELPAEEVLIPNGDLAVSRRLLRDRCPASPGVYGMIDAEGRVIYVGKSKSLRARLTSYFHMASLDSKSRRIIASARRMAWEPGPHEFVALLRELELIRRFCPRFNVRGRPGRGRRVYVALGAGAAARAYVTEKVSRRDRLVVGPLRAGRDLRRMVRTVNDCFQLRDCPAKAAVAFSDQKELFAGRAASGCIRWELGTCLGPCRGNCSSRQYADHVARARDFLRGVDSSILLRLERSMRSAAAAERYLRAAALRDQWRELTNLHELLERVRTVERTYSFVYPLPSYGPGETWYLIRRGQVVGATPSPTNPRAARHAMIALERTYFPGPRQIDLALPDDPDLILLVSFWFRAHPEELRRTLAPEAARQRCLELASGASLPRRASGPD